jgi:predicted MFS family arabinose efflux permease
MNVPSNEPLTTHHKIVIAILAFLQFTVIVDLMILSPLGALLMRELSIDTKQFGFSVSAYALAAGVSSFASAAFADKFDRKKLLLFFYVGFLVGTALCGVAPTYELLVVARVITGAFGGVIGSICMAIVADLFPLSMRGRVMGTMMTAFSAAQIAGVPAGLALSNWWGWHAPFLVIASVGAVVGVAIALVLKPLDAHLQGPAKPPALTHMLRTATKPAYVRVFATTVLLASGFLVMPLFSAFLVHNLHVDLDQLPLIYLVTGVATLVAGPVAGKLADSVGKYVVFAVGSLLAAGVFVAWANVSGPTALWIVIVVNTTMLVANTARMIAGGALISAVPAGPDRGAFMSLNSSLQQITGGVAAALGGALVVTQADGALTGFDTLCYFVVATIVVTLPPMWLIDREVRRRAA